MFTISISVLTFVYIVHLLIVIFWGTYKQFKTRLMVWMTLVNVTAEVNQVTACAKRNKQCYPFNSLLIMLESK